MKNDKIYIYPLHIFGVLAMFLVILNNLGYTFPDLQGWEYWSRVNLLTFLWFVFLLAYHEKRRDFNSISKHEPVKHGLGLFRRVCWIIGAALILRVNPFAIILGGAWFSLWFDYMLNITRGLDPLYISDSNNYDKFYIKLFGLNAGKVQLITEILITLFIFRVLWLS